MPRMRDLMLLLESSWDFSDPGSLREPMLCKSFLFHLLLVIDQSGPT
jgi:hypothetical protein